MQVPYGVHSMVAPLRHVLVQAPTVAFGAAYEDPAHGFLRPVDLEIAQKEHAELCELLGSFGVTVHQLDSETPSPDLVYTYDPALVTDDGVVLLRSGKPNRRGEEDEIGAWCTEHGIPTLGRIETPGTVDGGDIFWLRPDLVCVGRSLRTNQAGIDQLREILPYHLEVFDVPVQGGTAECLHLLSLISLVSDDLAVVDLPLLPSGLYSLLIDLGMKLLDIPRAEVGSLAANVLAVRPGVVVTIEGNSITRRTLEREGVEVHSFAGFEIAWNGSGGPTCLTCPLQRE